MASLCFSAQRLLLWDLSLKDLPQLSVGLNPQPLIVEELKMTSSAVADLRTQL